MPLVAALGLALVTGWAIATVWRRFAVPLGAFQPGLAGHPLHPRAWPRLYAVWLPLGSALITLTHVALRRVASVPRRFLHADLLGYGLAAGFLVLLVRWQDVGEWRLWCGAFYLGLLAVKAGLLLRAVYVGLVIAPTPIEAPPRWLGAFLGWTAFVVYGVTAAYVMTAVSTTGDEPYYLLVTHSLLHDRDLDLANNFAQRDYAPFYWGQLSGGPSAIENPSDPFYSITYSGLLAYLLLPGYALAGRLGATLTISLLAALAMAQVFWLALEISGSRRVAFLAWLGLAFVAPVFFFSSQLYPEIPAALAVGHAIRQVRRLPGQPGVRLGSLGIALLALPLLKLRYSVLALLLAGWAAWRLRHGRWAAVVLAAVVVGALALVALDLGALGGILYARYLRQIPLDVLLIPRPHMLRSLLGIAVDQEFGLLGYAPVYLLAALGLPLALRREPQTAWLVVIMAAYCYPFLHSAEWFGGFSLPSRYFVVLVPILAVFVVYALVEARGRATSTVVVTCWMWSVVVAGLLTVQPALRYNSGTGEARWLEWLGRAVSADLSRLLPSTVNPSPETPWLVAAFGVALLAGVSWVTWRNGRAAGCGLVFSPRVGLCAFGLLVVIALVAAGLGRTLPTLAVQGEAMAVSGWGVFFPGSNALPLKAWVMRSNGTLSRAIRLGSGAAVLRVYAAGNSSDAVRPHLVVSLDDQPVGEADVAAGFDEWRVAAYAFPVRATAGPHRLTLTFTNGVDDRRAGQIRYLLVDKITIEPAP